MEDKNRFSILLEHLLEVAEVKNYTLAKRLQYDVSYISKWVSGRMLPAKKTEKRVMEGISACVVDEATDDGRDLLLREYSVSIPSDLKAALNMIICKRSWTAARRALAPIRTFGPS